MDVKDINNVANTSLFSKAVAGNTMAGAIGAGFASLLNTVSLNPRENSSDLPVKTADNKDSAKVNERPQSEEDKRSQDISRPDKNDKPVAKDKDKSKAPAEDKPADKAADKKTSKVKDKDSAKTAAEDAPAAVAAPVAPTAEEVVVPVAAAQEAVVPVEAAAAETAPQDLTVTMKTPLIPCTFIDGKMTPLTDYLNNLAVLPQDSVMVYDPNGVLGLPVDELSGMVEVSAKELQGLLKSDKFVGFLKENGISIEGMIPVENGETIDISPVVAEASPAAPQKIKKIDEANIDLDKIIDGLDDETKEILANSDVKVKTAEEKIAYRSAADLLKDKVVTDDVDAALIPAEKAKTAAQATSASPLAAAPLTQANDNQAVAAPVAPAAVIPVQMQAAAEVATNVTAASNSAAKEVSALNLAQASSGSEFVNAARAEAGNKAADTSFRDVYKGMSREAVNQVKINITKSAVKGVDKIAIQLKPEDLGHIEIKMQIAKDGKLQAHITSNRPDTLDMLQKEVQSLEKAFNDAGFQTDEGSLSFSFRDDGQAGQNQDRNSELRNFIGNVFENEANNDMLSAGVSEWNGTNGLNIRV